LIPFITSSIEENNNDLISYSLAVLKQAFRNTEPNMVSISASQHAEPISKFLNSVLNHNQSRLASEALRVTGLFIIQLQDLEGNLDPEHSSVVNFLKESILNKLKKQDID
jgi:hypothetical protein